MLYDDGNIVDDTLKLFQVGPFRHNPNQRLRAGRTDQDTAFVAQFRFSR